MSNEDLDQLRKDTDSKDRLKNQPTSREAAEAGDEDNEPTFQEDLIRYLNESEGKVGSRNISVNDVNLWSVMQALDDHDNVDAELREKADVDRQSRSALLSKLIRIGIDETHPELAEEVRAGISKQAAEDF